MSFHHVLLVKPMKPNTRNVLIQMIQFVLSVCKPLHSTVLPKLPNVMVFLLVLTNLFFTILNENLHSLEYSTIYTLTAETAASKSSTTFTYQT